MIIINNFGWRLGNQMFQIAAAIALGEREKQDVLFPHNWNYAKIFEGDFSSVENPIIKQKNYYKESTFHYVKIPDKTNIIDGYFQSEKFFKDSEKTIRAKFKIKKEIIENVKQKHEQLLKNENTVSFHIRRGDYLNYPDHHPVLTMQYYMKALRLFPKDSIGLVFSDDINWCKENFPGLDDKFFIIEGQTDYEDFALMSLCKHNCISNSSFSWWAAYLNENKDKIVVAPEKWFGPAYAHFITNDIYVDTWIKI